VNKWDLVEDKQTNTLREYEAIIKKRLQPFNDVPVVFISVLEKQRIFDALEVSLQVYENRTRKIKTSELNEYMANVVEGTPPPSVKGRYPKFKYITQLPSHYPMFAYFVNNPKWVRDSYKQFLENKLREQFNFTGVPIELFMREK
jgi:GTP-binding protein